jgi:hypothetical protein
MKFPAFYGTELKMLLSCSQRSVSEPHSEAHCIISTRFSSLSTLFSHISVHLGLPNGLFPPALEHFSKKNAVSWDVMRCGSCTNRLVKLLVTANIIPSSLIPSTLMMEAIRSYETSVLTRATCRQIPEYGILHSPRPENHKSDRALIDWAL